MHAKLLDLRTCLPPSQLVQNLSVGKDLCSMRKVAKVLVNGSSGKIKISMMVVECRAKQEF